MSNDDQGVLDDVVRLAAYWKAMCKEFSGEVTKRAKRFLFSDKVEEALKAAISDACFASTDKLQRMMGPSQSQRNTRTRLERDVANMSEAVEACNELAKECSIDLTL